MSKILARLAKSSAFYTFANGIEAISPFLIAIIVTRLLSPSEYGIWVLFIALVTFLRPIVSFSLQDALRMHFYEMDYSHLARFVWSFFCFISIVTFLLLCATTIARDTLSNLLDLPADWLPAIVVMSFFFGIFYFLLAYNQFSQRPSDFITLHVIQTFSSLILISVLILTNWGWTGMVLGKIGGLAIACALGSYWINRELSIESARLQKPDLQPLLKFGLLYLPAGMGLVAIPLTDRVIVTHVLGLAENGFYGVASLFGFAVLVAVNGILHAWMPWLFRRLRKQSNNMREVWEISAVFLILLPIGGLLANVISVAIAPIVIGDRFESAFPLIPWAIAGSIAMGYFFHWQAFLLHNKAIWEMSISSGLCILNNAILSYFAAINFGLRGVFAATIIAFLLSAMLSAILLVWRFRTQNRSDWKVKPADQ